MGSLKARTLSRTTSCPRRKQRRWRPPPLSTTTQKQLKQGTAPHLHWMTQRQRHSPAATRTCSTPQLRQRPPGQARPASAGRQSWAPARAHDRGHWTAASSHHLAQHPSPAAQLQDLAQHPSPLVPLRGPAPAAHPAHHVSTPSAGPPIPDHKQDLSKPPAAQPAALSRRGRVQGQLHSCRQGRSCRCPGRGTTASRLLARALPPGLPPAAQLPLQRSWSDSATSCSA